MRLAELILRDEETVESYGIQNGQTVHCMHLITPLAHNAVVVQTHPPQGIGASLSRSTPPPQMRQPQQQQPPQQQQQQQQQIPTSLASGAGAFNPFAALTGARYAGQMPLPSASLFGPDRTNPCKIF